ncbi:MAG: RdgB/HAM1 family non-canonical purine NTP pyrophosphatase [Ruminococcaceae bacterium]|nr:RdgB/HAM1 family non-canonical purine NTP pyrophosphatase [Oscillospiraceae bacterium]
MKLVLASRNRKKIHELRTLLSKFFDQPEILSLDDVGITEEIEENGTTFEENALIKARAAAVSGYIAVGDDSGLTVDALGGDPGIYSARYAARCHFAGDHDDEGNNQALLQNMKGLPEEQRGGAFVCCIACVLPDGREMTVRGEARGRILESYAGNGGFGYDPLFYYEPLQKTFAELTFEEKNEVSHRGRAIAAFAEKLKEAIGDV